MYKRIMTNMSENSSLYDKPLESQTHCRQDAFPNINHISIILLYLISIYVTDPTISISPSTNFFI